MCKQIGSFFGVILEQSNHLLGILLIQQCSIGQVVDDSSVLGNFMDHVESNIAKTNPLNGV